MDSRRVLLSDNERDAAILIVHSIWLCTGYTSCGEESRTSSCIHQNTEVSLQARPEMGQSGHFATAFLIIPYRLLFGHQVAMLGDLLGTSFGTDTGQNEKDVLHSHIGTVYRSCLITAWLRLDHD